MGIGDDGKIAVSILGGTGLVGRALAAHLLQHPLFRLSHVVGSASTAGKCFEEVWIDKEEALASHYGRSLWTAAPFPDGLKGKLVASTEALLASSPDKHIVVSAIAPRLGHIEDALQTAGFKVFSISPHARTLPANPLVIPEANGEVMLSALKRAVETNAPFPLIKSPNCVTCGMSVVLKALDDAFVIDSVAVTTFQALSGRGDAKYDPALVVGNVYPLTGTTEKTDDYQRAELMRIFPHMRRCAVAAHRVPVQVGHFADLKVQTRRKVHDPDMVYGALESFNPLKGYDLPSQPAQPIVVCREPGRPRPKDDCWNENGMAVAVGNVRTPQDGFFDITLSVVLNNVTRGAYGAALINAELYELHYSKELQQLKISTQGDTTSGVTLTAEKLKGQTESAILDEKLKQEIPAAIATEYRCTTCACRVSSEMGWCPNCGGADFVAVVPAFRCSSCNREVTNENEWCSHCGSDDIFCFN